MAKRGAGRGEGEGQNKTRLPLLRRGWVVDRSHSMSFKINPETHEEQHPSPHSHTLALISEFHPEGKKKSDDHANVSSVCATLPDLDLECRGNNSILSVLAENWRHRAGTPARHPRAHRIWRTGEKFSGNFHPPGRQRKPDGMWPPSGFEKTLFTLSLEDRSALCFA